MSVAERAQGLSLASRDKLSAAALLLLAHPPPRAQLPSLPACSVPGGRSTCIISSLEIFPSLSWSYS